jgi:hypothetical protein
MIAPQSPPTPAALAARWREDAQVFRRYGAAGRARMLERMADKLECAAGADQSRTVDLSTAAELSGFTRAHLRRLIREGKLAATSDGTRVRASDLPRKRGHTLRQVPARCRVWPSGREAVSDLLARPERKRASPPPRRCITESSLPPKKSGRRARGGQAPPLARRSCSLPMRLSPEGGGLRDKQRLSPDSPPPHGLSEQE